MNYDGPEKVKQQCLLAINQVLTALIEEFEDDQEREQLFEKIWALPSLQCFLQGIAGEVDEIMTLSEYKIAEICALIMSQIKINLQESKVGRLVTSLNYLKMTLKNGLKYDVKALNMLVAAEE